MNTAEALIHALRDAKELERQYTMPFAPAPAGGPYETEVYQDGVAVRVRADDSGRYGLRLRRVHLSSDQDDHGVERQEEILLALTTRTSTPYGSLFCEDGGEALRAVLRTHEVGASRSCYEAVLSEGNDVVLTHYATPAGGTDREATPVDIGMDMFRVMIGDLVDAMQHSAVMSG